jgi:hypothetical protein
MSNSNISAQSLLDFARIHAKLIPVIGVGGISGEPGISIVNDVLGEVFAAPYNWKFNRNEMTMFMTRQFVQDYTVSGAIAFVLQNSTNAPAGNCGGVAIDLTTNPIRGTAGLTESGTTVTCNTIEAHPFKVGQTVYITGTNSAYDNTYSLSLAGAFSGGYTITAVPTAYSFRFTHSSSGLANSGAPGITNFGWLESGSVMDVSNTSTPQPIGTCFVVKMLEPSSETANPEKFAVVADNGNGTLRVRCYPCPSTYSWAVNLVYQAKAPRITTLQQTLTPWPDELAYVTRQGVIAKAFRYVDQARYVTEYQLFLNNIARALGQKDSENSSQGFYPMRPILLD